MPQASTKNSIEYLFDIICLVLMLDNLKVCSLSIL